MSLVLAGICVLAASLPAPLCAFIVFLINNNIGGWGNGNADILMLIAFGGMLWAAGAVLGFHYRLPQRPLAK